MPPCAMADEGFEEFLRARREQAERTRRLLIGVLAVTCIALAVSNVVLALRLTVGRARSTAEAPPRLAETPARPATTTESSAAPASVAARAEAPPSVTLPTTAEPSRPEPAEPRSASVPAEQPARADAPSPSIAEGRPPAPELPPRPLVASAPSRRVAAARATTPPPPAALPARAVTPAPATPDEATAAWMLTTYGRADAEARARAALDFYDAESAEGRYWRRVLGLIVAAR